jgi:hypothetical protein
MYEYIRIFQMCSTDYKGFKTPRGRVWLFFFFLNLNEFSFLVRHDISHHEKYNHNKPTLIKASIQFLG